MEITIGMASYNNFQQVWWTVQTLRMYQDLDDCEILIADNFGDKKLEMFVRNCLFSNTRYILANEIQGTAYPRDKVFEHAKGKFVLCIDSHVLLEPGAIKNLKEWIKKNEGRDDLFHGTLVYDDGKTYAIGMKPEWKCNMYGVWMDTKVAPTEEIEIPMHGLGLFGCFKDKWLGFNKDFREFGGEEGYIHEKYRQNWSKIILLPFLKWQHFFASLDPQPPKYKLSMESRIKNYLIGWTELGLDIKPIKEHFSSYIIDTNFTIKRR